MRKIKWLMDKEQRKSATSNFINFKRFIKLTNLARLKAKKRKG